MYTSGCFEVGQISAPGGQQLTVCSQDAHRAILFHRNLRSAPLRLWPQGWNQHNACSPKTCTNFSANTVGKYWKVHFIKHIGWNHHQHRKLLQNSVWNGPRMPKEYDRQRYQWLSAHPVSIRNLMDLAQLWHVVAVEGTKPKNKSNGKQRKIKKDREKPTPHKSHRVTQSHTYSNYILLHNITYLRSLLCTFVSSFRWMLQSMQS